MSVEREVRVRPPRDGTGSASACTGTSHILPSTILKYYAAMSHHLQLLACVTLGFVFFLLVSYKGFLHLTYFNSIAFNFICLLLKAFRCPGWLVEV